MLGKRRAALGAADVKYFVERYLRQKVKSEKVICEKIKGGRVEVRTASPTLQQEVYLLEYDLKLALNKELNFKLKELKVFTR